MIFSAIEFVPNGREDQRRAVTLRSEPYAQHQSLWNLFDLPKASPRPFLFRFRDEEAGVRFWMLSDVEPKSCAPAWQIRSKTFAPSLSAGDEFSFELRVNATTSVRRPGQRGLRVDVIADGLKATPAGERPALRAQLVHCGLPAWLAKRAGSMGFELAPRPAPSVAKAKIEGLPPCVVHRYEVWHLDKSRRNEVTLGVSDLAGRLRVTDTERFNRTIATGVGHGKGFGLGMFLLKRIHCLDSV